MTTHAPTLRIVAQPDHRRPEDRRGIFVLQNKPCDFRVELVDNDGRLVTEHEELELVALVRFKGGEECSTVLELTGPRAVRGLKTEVCAWWEGHGIGRNWWWIN